MSARTVAATLGAAASAACSYNLESYSGISPAMDAPVMTYAAYTEVKHGNPYVLRLAVGAGALVHFGARHTTDPDDPQIDSIRTLWNALRPTIALAEARKGVRGSLERGVRSFGESAAVIALAKGDGIPAYTLEAPLDLEIATILRRWSRERVLLFYVLRSYTARAVERRSDGQASELVRKRGDWPGLEGTFSTIREMDSIWAGEFPGGPDWRTLPWQATWPDRDDTWLNRLSADLNRFRDLYMVALIDTLLRRGERVFAVVGSSHVVMQEPALRAALRLDSTRGDPMRRLP